MLRIMVLWTAGLACSVIVAATAGAETLSVAEMMAQRPASLDVDAKGRLYNPEAPIPAAMLHKDRRPA